jgi:peptide/nickel transport system ATP-binding protein
VRLAGESGSGKSTLGRLSVGLETPVAGMRLWKGRALAAKHGAQGRRAQLAMQMVFQDAHAALNPRMRVGAAITEAPYAHGLVDAADRSMLAERLMLAVGLDPSMLQRLPHQLSGGQAGRVGIARALAVNPEFLVFDEAVAALDVSIQAQVINLILRLREDMGLTYLFISHDLALVRHVSDRVAIMYMGRIVELAASAQLFTHAAHPYTQTLLAATPRFQIGKVAFMPMRRAAMSSSPAPTACHFEPRCPHAILRCKLEQPAMREIAPLHFAACHLHGKSA